MDLPAAEYRGTREYGSHPYDGVTRPQSRTVIGSSIQSTGAFVPAISLFAGVGMLDLSVRLALEQFGHRARTVAYVERDSAAAALLVAGMEAAYLDRAPVWDQLETFDGRRFRGCVALTASPPCPSFSAAGKRGGNDDHRAFGLDGNGPQAHTLRIIGECRPALVFLENVPQWVTGGHFERFGRGLCEMGYAIQDPIFVTAASVGGAHKRERVFVLAVAGGGRGRFVQQGRGPEGRSTSGGTGPELAHTRRGGGEPRAERERVRATGPELAECQSRGQRIGREPPRSDRQPAWSDAELAVAAGDGGRKGSRAEGDAGRRQEPGEPLGVLGDAVGDSQRTQPGTGDQNQQGQTGLGGSGLADAGHRVCRGGRLPVFAPARNDYRAWAAALGLDPTVAPAIEPPLPMVVDGHAFSHADLLRCGGNSVVPLAGATAFFTLLDRLWNPD